MFDSNKIPKDNEMMRPMKVVNNHDYYKMKTNMCITGGIVTKCNLLYVDAKQNYNRAFDKFPCVVNFCFTDEDVSNAIRYAREKDICFRVRSGRHDYEANSNLNCGLIIDISNIDYVIIDEKKQCAKLGGGILSGKMYETLVQKNYTIPSGTCSDVGYAGLTTCGGVGFAARYLGLACDNLLEAEIINYKGEKIIANKYKNCDLFWALRGGLGANFGVIVSLTYKITPVCFASTYVITWDFKYFKEVFDTWQSVTPFLDNRLSTGLSLSRDNGGDIYLSSSGQFFGPKDELVVLIKELLTVAPTMSVEIEDLPYSEVLKKWNDNCFSPNKFKATGSYIYKELDENTIDFLRNSILFSPNDTINLFEFIGLSGKVSEVGSFETAYFHRKALYLIEIKSIWDCNCKANESIDWVEFVKEELDFVGIGTYRGFTDFCIDDWQYQYYGLNYKRLQEVKKIYDPKDIFNFPHSIQLPRG